MPALVSCSPSTLNRTRRSLDGAIKHIDGFGVRSLTTHPPTLEELMLRHYEHQDGSGEAA